MQVTQTSTQQIVGIAPETRCNTVYEPMPRSYGFRGPRTVAVVGAVAGAAGTLAVVAGADAAGNAVQQQTVANLHQRNFAIRSFATDAAFDVPACVGRLACILGISSAESEVGGGSLQQPLGSTPAMPMAARAAAVPKIHVHGVIRWRDEVVGGESMASRRAGWRK